jgi:hypothetical protein
VDERTEPGWVVFRDPSNPPIDGNWCWITPSLTIKVPTRDGGQRCYRPCGEFESGPLGVAQVFR